MISHLNRNFQSDIDGNLWGVNWCLHNQVEQPESGFNSSEMITKKHKKISFL